MNSELSFETMDLSSEILKAVRAMGFQEPSTVQAKTIPLMMEGVDINAIAPTGTGKTCAFGIPMLEYVQLRDSRVQEIVLTPTARLRQIRDSRSADNSLRVFSGPIDCFL